MILKDYSTLTNSGKSIALCWIPSHVNIPGNERADAAAKLALSLPITGMKLPGCDLIPRVSNYCLREWQEIWSNCVNNKLYAIYQTVGSVVRNKGLSRHESVIINRLRIGHTRPISIRVPVVCLPLICLSVIHLSFWIYHGQSMICLLYTSPSPRD